MFHFCNCYFITSYCIIHWRRQKAENFDIFVCFTCQQNVSLDPEYEDHLNKLSSIILKTLKFVQFFICHPFCTHMNGLDKSIRCIYSTDLDTKTGIIPYNPFPNCKGEYKIQEAGLYTRKRIIWFHLTTFPHWKVCCTRYDLFWSSSR